MSGSQVDKDVEMFTAGLDAFEEAKAKTPKSERKPTKSTPAPEVNVPLEDDSAQKAAVMRKITSYLREFPDKLGEHKLPKAFTQKATLAEMKMLLSDLEHEMGKSGAFDIVRSGFISLCSGIEQFQAKTKTLPYNLTNYGKMAEFSASHVRQPDGNIKTGEMVPLLKEFSIKYGKLFGLATWLSLYVLRMKCEIATGSETTSAFSFCIAYDASHIVASRLPDKMIKLNAKWIMTNVTCLFVHARQHPAVHKNNVGHIRAETRRTGDSLCIAAF